MPPKKDGKFKATSSKKPRCARKLSYCEKEISGPVPLNSEPGTSSSEPGPSRPRPVNLAEQLKKVHAANVLHKKHVAMLTSEQKERLAFLKEQKQVGSFMLPDAPEPKKGKGKGKGKGQDKDLRRIPCPLLPGVPTVPPPKIPQLWEIQHSRETESMAGVARQGTTPFTISEPLTETAEDDEIIEGSPSRILSIPQHLLGMAKGEDIVEDTLRPLEVMHKTFSTSPQAKKRRIFSPSTGIIQASVLPLSPMNAEIEYLGFTPSSTTSNIPGSGRSAMSYEIGVEVDVERDLEELGDVNAGSDIDADTDLVDNPLRHRDAFEYSTVLEGSEDPGLIEAVKQIDAEADAALRALTDSEDYLHFDWKGEAENFTGVREQFTGPSGPTFDTSGLTPLDILKKIWDDNIIALIVTETNRYARQLRSNPVSKFSRLSRWSDTTEDEIWRVLGIIMLQSLVVINAEREYWYPKLEDLRVGNFGEIMSYNRFLLIKRCIHFVDNTLHHGHTNRLQKVMPLIEHLNKKFSSLYLPEQNVAIDESLLLWKGRLSFAQLIATKRAKAGIKSYELCESRTGYLWKMEIYTGKGHVHAPQEEQEAVVTHVEPTENEPKSATSQIVFSLMRSLFNRGHTLVMDNFYNAPLLSRLLKAKYKTDTMGTLRLNREFVPESLKGKNKRNMSTGEVCFSTTKDLNVVVWLDKNVVAMISTFHEVKIGGKEKYGYYHYKPQVVLDYNLSMGGIDHKDQMLHAYPVERVRNMVWYKKLFRRLLNVSIHNAFVIYTHSDNQIGNRDFRLQLVQQILHAHSPRPPARPTPLAMHLPVKNARAQRCKLCHAAKVRRTTVWRCGTCQVNLCIEGCYTVYHTQASSN